MVQFIANLLKEGSTHEERTHTTRLIYHWLIHTLQIHFTQASTQTCTQTSQYRLWLVPIWKTIIWIHTTRRIYKWLIHTLQIHFTQASTQTYTSNITTPPVASPYLENNHLIIHTTRRIYKWLIYALQIHFTQTSTQTSPQHYLTEWNPLITNWMGVYKPPI